MNPKPETRNQKPPLRILVLAGGPDRERPVSLNSGAEVARALREAGHEVLERDIGPNNLAALDEFVRWPGDVIFPVLHGRWGEGGPLQHILDERELPYVGCAGPAAELCMNKHRTKLALEQQGLPTPPFEVLCPGELCRLSPPVVVKPIDEGSSIDLTICHDAAAIEAARHHLRPRHPKLLIERFIVGHELTVGLIGPEPGTAADLQVLPPIHIVPATTFYDYEAKYTREDTQYRFDIDLPPAVLDEVQRLAAAAHHAVGARHMSRVDFIVDREHRPWILEINTIPGFTTHSLLPMAARRAGLSMPQLVDRLVRLPLADRG